jgi:hypothetical protein
MTKEPVKHRFSSDIPNPLSAGEKRSEKNRRHLMSTWRKLPDEFGENEQWVNLDHVTRIEFVTEDDGLQYSELTLVTREKIRTEKSLEEVFKSVKTFVSQADM